MRNGKAARCGLILSFCAFCALLAAAPCNAQQSPWYLTRGGTNLDEAWGVDVDSAGNVYWATCEIPSGSFYFDINLYKFDAAGRQIWKSTPWGGPFNDKAFITVVKAPYVYVAGRTDTSADINSAHALVLAYDMDSGALAWSYTWDRGFGYQEVDGLAADSSGVYISGWSAGDTTSNDMFIQKLNLQGKLMWSTTWGTKRWDEANGHMVVDADDIYLAGRMNGAGELSLDGDAVLACFRKSNGAFVWDSTWGGAGYNDAYGMAMSPDSFLYVTGLTGSFGGSKIFLLKYARNGHLVWDALWGGAGGQAARAVAADGDSIVYVAGKTASYGAGGNDIVLLKYDSAGNLLWYKTWGGAADDQTHDVVRDGAFLYITGETSSIGAGKSDALLLKADGRDGEFPSMQTPVNDGNVSPQTFRLGRNYPNPLGDATTFDYSLPRTEYVTLKFYNALGIEVATLVNGEESAGAHIVQFNARGLSGGVYRYRLRAGNLSQAGEMIVVK